MFSTSLTKTHPRHLLSLSQPLFLLSPSHLLTPFTPESPFLFSFMQNPFCLTPSQKKSSPLSYLAFSLNLSHFLFNTHTNTQSYSIHANIHQLRAKMRGGLWKMEKDKHGIETDGGFVGNFFESLPEGFVANALALTSPRDVCRLSLVCSVFRSAAEWDAVWEKFLPPDYRNILGPAEGGGSKKEMYMRLCDHPVIVDGGNKSFSLDKPTGKRCYMIAARDLSIIWGDTPRYWRWISVPESRFTEVAELKSVCWLEVRGKVNTSILSTNTRYASYLVYKSTSDIYGFESLPAEVSTGLHGAESETKTVFLDPEASQRSEPEVGLGRRLGILSRLRRLGSQSSNGSTRVNGPKMRQDGWLEVELGEYYNEREEEGELEMSVMEVKGGNWKGGLVIQGIEIRPKAC